MLVALHLVRITATLECTLMPPRVTFFVVAACAGLIALAAWVLDWSFERAAILAPVVVAVAGAVGFLVVLWARVAWELIRGRKRP